MRKSHFDTRELQDVCPTTIMLPSILKSTDRDRTRKYVTPLSSAGLHRDQYSCSTGARPAAPLTARPRYMSSTSAFPTRSRARGPSRMTNHNKAPTGAFGPWRCRWSASTRPTTSPKVSTLQAPEFAAAIPRQRADRTVGRTYSCCSVTGSGGDLWNSFSLILVLQSLCCWFTSPSSCGATSRAPCSVPERT